MDQHINKMRKAAKSFFRVMDYKGMVIALLDSHYMGRNTCFCGHHLIKDDHMFTDKKTGRFYGGKQCRECGTIIMERAVLRDILMNVTPWDLVINNRINKVPTNEKPDFTVYKNKLRELDNAILVNCSQGDFSILKPAPPEKKTKKKPKGVTADQTVKDSIDTPVKEPTEEQFKKKVNVISLIQRNTSRSLMHLGIESFLVRSNTFSCDKKGHKLSQVDGIIKVVVRNTGSIKALLIPAGYCKQCDKYFVMESTYEQLLSYGTPLCRIRTIHNTSSSKSDKFSKYKEESILMEYGYTVSKQMDLSGSARHSILALLMDYNICSRFKIISYLDSFINDHKHQAMMIDAVRHWEADRLFVEQYKKESMKKEWIDVLEIHKNSYNLSTGYKTNR